MSEFVNFNKRDVALPAGCKDLFDVLMRQREMRKRQEIADATDIPTVVREAFSGRLEDGESVIRRFFQSESSPALLFVSPPCEFVVPSVGLAGFHVRRLTNGSFVGTVSVDLESDEERAVRLFLAENGLDIEPDSGMPSVFLPHIPVQLFIDVRPIPTDADAAHALVLSLLRVALRMTGDTQVAVTWYGKG